MSRSQIAEAQPDSQLAASQVRTQRRLAELDAALAAVDAVESAELAAIERAGSQRQADAVRPSLVT